MLTFRFNVRRTAFLISPLSRYTFCGVIPRYHWVNKDVKPLDDQSSKFTHKSNAQELINQVPVVEVDGDIARCTGVQEMGYGHPLHYIQLSH